MTAAENASVRPHSIRRVPWVDVAKGICITLVVYGHVHGGLVDAQIVSGRGISASANAIIYTFHMPAFFLVAGIFIEKSSHKKPAVFAADKLRTILYPYILWSVLQLTANALLSRYTNFGAHFSDLRMIFFKPSAQFWFLYVLFVYLFAAYFLLRLRVPPGLIMILGLAIYPFSESLRESNWPPLFQITYFFVYFATGIFLSRFLLNNLPGLSRLEALMTAVACAIVLCFLRVDQRDGNPIRLAICSAFGISGVMLTSISIIGTRLEKPLRLLGNCSLEIYLAHILCAAGLRIFLMRALQIRDPGVHLVGGILAGILIPVAMVAIAKHLGVPWLFTLRNKPPTLAIVASEPNVVPATF